jgi:hypothetical protein
VTKKLRNHSSHWLQRTALFDKIVIRQTTSHPAAETCVGDNWRELNLCKQRRAREISLTMFSQDNTHVWAFYYTKGEAHRACWSESLIKFSENVPSLCLSQWHTEFDTLKLPFPHFTFFKIHNHFIFSFSDESNSLFRSTITHTHTRSTVMCLRHMSDFLGLFQCNSPGTLFAIFVATLDPHPSTNVIPNFDLFSLRKILSLLHKHWQHNTQDTLFSLSFFIFAKKKYL